jgi:hypothetical protein
MLTDELEESASGLNGPSCDVTKGSTKKYSNFFLATKQLTFTVYTYNYS